MSAWRSVFCLFSFMSIIWAANGFAYVLREEYALQDVNDAKSNIIIWHKDGELFFASCPAVFPTRDTCTVFRHGNYNLLFSEAEEIANEQLRRERFSIQDETSKLQEADPQVRAFRSEIEVFEKTSHVLKGDLESKQYALRNEEEKRANLEQIKNSLAQQMKAIMDKLEDFPEDELLRQTKKKLEGKILILDRDLDDKKTAIDELKMAIQIIESEIARINADIKEVGDQLISLIQNLQVDSWWLAFCRRNEQRLIEAQLKLPYVKGLILDDFIPYSTEDLDDGSREMVHILINKKPSWYY